MGAAGGPVGAPGPRGGRNRSRTAVLAVVACLVVANLMLLVLPTVLGLFPVVGVVPVVGVDAVAVAAVVVLAPRGDDPLAGTLLSRRYPGLARVAAGLLVVWAVVAVAGDSVWALVAAPAGVFALAMALFRTTAVWWRWCARAAAVSMLAWPAPVLAGMRLDRNAIEAYGTGFGLLVAMALVGLSACLATLAAVGWAVDGRARPTPTTREAATD